MKALEDQRSVMSLGEAQRGVFSTADLRSALADRHPAAFGRRIRKLVEEGVLFRFTRGFYVTEEFELPVLSQRIAPESCISFETVLARELVIGPRPERRVVATKAGPSRRYESRGFVIEHLRVSPGLTFGCETVQGVRMANVEKAVLDVLYFHLRGRRYSFDIYSDLDPGRLDRARVKEYLARYANPKFRSFAASVLEIA
jgi:hypothetical protein